MSGKDNTGWKRGVGAYSKDYAKFDDWGPGFPSRQIWSKVEGVGDYDGDFTGPVSRSSNHPSQGNYSKRGEGAYTKSKGVRSNRGEQQIANANGGQKVSD